MSEGAAPTPRRRWHFRRGWWLPLGITLLLWLGILVYPVLRLVGLLAPGWQPGTATLLAVMVLPLLGRIGYTWRPGKATRWLSAACLTWLGACFVLLCLLLPFEALVLAATALGSPLPGVASGQVLLAAWLLVVAASWVNAQVFQTRTIDLPAPEGVAGTTLVQVSDVHIGSRFGGLLERMVRHINGLAPDRVVITGDLVDFADISSEELAPLAGLEAPTWFCIGNHERYVDVDAICARLAGHGIRVLRDTAVVDGPVQFIGIDDADSRQTVARGLAAIDVDPERYSILLYHRPDGFEDAAAAGVDLMLAGHTHFGQILPFHWVVKRVFPRIKGLYALADSPARLYVSPGTGTWGPVLRLGSRCEVTRFRFTPGP